ncbi:hypothetical protein DL93DRAFT_2230578 [Clavulina sp. PMI_390]|nr:hypothetical protein DL93DRAFT_2230578 [Clavulina sp. PMI_390]
MDASSDSYDLNLTSESEACFSSGKKWSRAETDILRDIFNHDHGIQKNSERAFFSSLTKQFRGRSWNAIKNRATTLNLFSVVYVGDKRWKFAPPEKIASDHDELGPEEDSHKQGGQIDNCKYGLRDPRSSPSSPDLSLPPSLCKSSPPPPPRLSLPSPAPHPYQYTKTYSKATPITRSVEVSAIREEQPPTGTQHARGGSSNSQCKNALPNDPSSKRRHTIDSQEHTPVKRHRHDASTSPQPLPSHQRSVLSQAPSKAAPVSKLPPSRSLPASESVSPQHVISRHTTIGSQAHQLRQECTQFDCLLRGVIEGRPELNDMDSIMEIIKKFSRDKSIIWKLVKAYMRDEKLFQKIAICRKQRDPSLPMEYTDEDFDAVLVWSIENDHILPTTPVEKMEASLEHFARNKMGGCRSWLHWQLVYSANRDIIREIHAHRVAIRTAVKAEPDDSITKDSDLRPPFEPSSGFSTSGSLDQTLILP